MVKSSKKKLTFQGEEQNVFLKTIYYISVGSLVHHGSAKSGVGIESGDGGSRSSSSLQNCIHVHATNTTPLGYLPPTTNSLTTP